MHSFLFKEYSLTAYYIRLYSYHPYKLWAQNIWNLQNKQKPPNQTRY